MPRRPMFPDMPMIEPSTRVAGAARPETMPRRRTVAATSIEGVSFAMTGLFVVIFLDQ